MAKFEIVPLAELKTRLPAKLMPLVEEYKERLEKAIGRPGWPAGAREGRRPEGSPAGAQGSSRGAGPKDPFSGPRGGGSRELLPREDAGPEAESGDGGGWLRSEAARETEEGGVGSG
ncbi:MAG: hypothetical protein HYS14_06415 [Candidatus Rokubacteria bacterium]|nr:hypothetical protein [Candidatus Rokubacteria bacterium]